MHQLYALEGFLTRLAIFPHANQLVLKGAALLAAYDTRRPTRDVDLQARAVDADLDQMRRLIAGIAAIAIEDGLMFDAARRHAPGTWRINAGPADCGRAHIALPTSLLNRFG